MGYCHYFSSKMQYAQYFSFLLSRTNTHLETPYRSMMQCLNGFQMIFRRVSKIRGSDYILPPPGPDFVIITLYCTDSTADQ